MTITLRERVRVVAYEPGSRKPFSDQIVGEDLCIDTGKYLNKTRLIHYKQDLYRETLIDPETGKVLHHCEEPLSKHRGHGSAKRRMHGGGGKTDQH